MTNLLRLDLQHFADEVAPQETQSDAPTSDEAVVDAPESESQAPAEQQNAEKTFTQAELDELLGKRLERERKKFEGFDELKKKAEAYEKELEEKRLSELSEQERLQEIARKYEEEKQLLAQKLADLQEKNRQQAIHNEFIKVATSHNVAYVDDALKLADMSAVNVGEDGTVEGVEDVIKALVEHKPFLLGKPAAKPVGQPSNGAPERTDNTKEQLLTEAADKARRSGKPEDVAAYSKLKRELGL